ncbi:MAG: ATP-binding protein [Candidatus Nanohaloarchaea archaeon]
MSRNSLEVPNLFESCEPRNDVIEGKLEEQQFAANLGTVAFEEEGVDVYKQASSFFQTTYPTEGLKSILTNLMAQFSTQSEESGQYTNSILALDTTFGGGKTHNLIAAYHLANNPNQIDNISKFSESSEVSSSFENEVDAGLDVNTGVFVGGYVDAQNTRCLENDPDAPNTQTMWGELAYQLFGNEGYEKIKDYDKEQNAPGEKTLKKLFDEFEGPSLVLIDEIAEYLEDASAVEIGNATLSSQTLSFLDSLIETAARVEDLVIVYSIADTAFTDEAEEVRDQINQMDSIAKRQHRTVAPTSGTEIGSVLRHRLFEEIQDDAAEEVAEKYHEFYQNSSRTLPEGMEDVDYDERIKREYPFHPTVLSVLTEKIDSLPNFQRTRGALQLLARSIYHLWDNHPENYERHFLRIYDMTPADNDPAGSISSKLNETLFEEKNLNPAVEADIYTADGDAHAQKEDQKWTEKGLPGLGSQVTVTVLWHSLAIGERATGVTRDSLYAAVAHPEINFDDYDAAIEALTGQSKDMASACYFLYHEDLFKFKSVPNLIRLIDKHKSNVTLDRAENRFEERLKQEIGSSVFEHSLFPEDPANMPDNFETPRIGVMHYDSVSVESDNGRDIETPDLIEKLYQKTAAQHGGRTEARKYKNYALFLVPDTEMIDDAREEARKLEGMENLREQSTGQGSDLTDEQFEELEERIETATGLLGEQVRTVYRHLYYPESGGLEHATIASVDSGNRDILEAIQVTLSDLDRIIRDDSKAKGPTWFKNRLWQTTKSSMTTQQLQKQFSKKPGLPYLLSVKPLKKTIKRMVEEKDYVYWNEKECKAYYCGDEKPDNWSMDRPVTDSPDVKSSIRSSDIQISDSHRLYETLGDLLEQQTIQEPEPETPECAECGKELPNANGNKPHYCDDCKQDADAHCQECGKELSEYDPEDEPITCEECKNKGPSSWTETTESSSASRALKQIRKKARSEAEDENPVLNKLVIEIEGDERLKHGFFLAKQSSLKDRSENLTVELDYRTEVNIEGSRTTFSTNFEGPLSAFRNVNNQLESFTKNRDDAERTITLKYIYNNADEEIDGKTDIISELLEETGVGNIQMQIIAEGKTARGE